MVIVTFFLDNYSLDGMFMMMNELVCCISFLRRDTASVDGREMENNMGY